MALYNSVSQDSIADMVDTFYGKVRSDSLLGPIFEAAIGNDWGVHLSKMTAFWSSILLASATYKGNPMIAHLQLPLLTPRHFERWLELWRETAGALCSAPLAAVFTQKAEAIAARLLNAISLYHPAAFPGAPEAAGHAA